MKTVFRSPNHSRSWTAACGRLFVIAALGLLAGRTVCTAQALVAAMQDVPAVETVSADNQDGDPTTIILKTNRPAEPAFLYSTQVRAQVQLSDRVIEQSIEVRLKRVQGRPKSVRLGLSGPGEIESVQGADILAWAVRTQGAERFLDLEISPQATEIVANIQAKNLINGTDGATIGDFELTHFTPGDSVGFDAQIRILSAAGIAPRVVVADGFMRLSAVLGDNQIAPGLPNAKQDWGFQTSTGGKLILRLVRSGGELLPVQWNDVSLAGDFAASSASIAFNFKGTAVVTRPGARVRLVNTAVAPSEVPNANNDVRLVLATRDQQSFYELEFAKAGSFDLDLHFVAKVQNMEGNWQAVNFQLTADAVVPLSIRNLPSDLQFARESAATVPTWDGQSWQAFLPASGDLNLRWKNARSASEGKLFFTTSAQSEVTVGPGLLRQDHQVQYQVLQGQLKSASIDLVGPGEILDVEGENIVGWKVESAENGRRLEIALGQAIVGQSQFQVRSQTPLDAFPVRVEGLNLRPVGAIRHSGHLRISNTGSVRLTPTDLRGLTQLGPETFPGPPLDARQLFVYRFPSADYSFSIAADRIQPEVNINQVVVYSLAPAERVITAEIELDIREAAIREWRFAVPDDYSIVAVTGVSVADYIVASEVNEGRRDLKVIFTQDIQGRQLVTLQLEKNVVATSGIWALPRIEHPDAKAVRGDVGVVGAAGFRIVSGENEFLVEKPVSAFPNTVANLQQAYRIRQPDWSASMQIEQLDRSIQADLFHLYSLSQGTVYGSALVNYFVTGAPTAEWKLNVPAALGNVTVDGQDVRSWRRDGDTLLVTLQQPVMGSYTLLLTFEQKPDQTDASFIAGQVAPLDVQGDRGYVQIVSPMQVEIERLQVSNGLLELDALELPAEFRLLSTSPALGTWQYTQRPFDLKLKVNWFEPGTMAAQVVEFSEANSHVSPDGELVTDVVYYVKSRGQRTLRLQLPGQPVRLWAVSVNNQPVSARQADDVTLIPLPGGADPNVPIEVNLRLGKPVVDGQETQVALPVVFAPVLKTQWKIEGDENFVVVSNGGTVDATRPVVWPNGFDTLAQNAWLPLLIMTVLVVLGTLLGRGVIGPKLGGDSVHRMVIENDQDREALPPSALDASASELPNVSQATLAAGELQTSGPKIAWYVLGRFVLLVLCSSIAIAMAVSGALLAFSQAMPPASLQLNLPVLAAGERVEIAVQNVPAWQIHFSVWGLGLLLGGIILGAVGRWLAPGGTSRGVLFVALGLMSVGTLLQPNGAIWFFVLFSLIVLLLQWLAAVKTGLWSLMMWSKQSWRGFWNRRAARRAVDLPDAEATPRDTAGSSGVVAPLLAFAVFCAASIDNGNACEAQDSGFQSASALTQQWDVSHEQQRLSASASVTLDGRPGDQFVLLTSPAVLTRFEGAGLRLTKGEVPGVGLAYIVTIAFDESATTPADAAASELGTAPSSQEPTDPSDDRDVVTDRPPQPQEEPSAVRAGAAERGDLKSELPLQRLTATFDYTLEGLNFGQGIPVLTGRTALHKIDVTFDQPGWEATCAAAVRIQNLGAAADGKPDRSDMPQTRLQLLLLPETAPIVLRPKARDLSLEATQFFVETAQLYTPGPGVVDGRHRLTIRASQGRVGDLRVNVAEGLTVSSVEGPVVAWQFDADNRHLNLEIDPTAEAKFQVLIETQRALDPLPSEVVLAPLRVEGADGEVGLIALAFASDAQPEKIESTGFSQVNIGDFDNTLVHDSKAVVQRVFRYGLEAGNITVTVVPVSAEVRVISQQVLSLGDQRIVLSINFVAEITRTGLFQLSFPLPEGLEVESLSGEALHHWSELVTDEGRQIVLHLNGKTIGNPVFALVLAGAAAPESGDWQVPRFAIDQAGRQAGDLLIRPIPGIRLQAATRQNVSELDPREMSGGQERSENAAGALAFRLLQRDWNLVLGIEKLDPWVTAQVVHEVNLREGQTRSTLFVDVNIENAAVRSLPITLPIADGEVIKTIRASGESVGDFVPSAPDSETWELQFKRRVIGRVQFQIEYERRGDRSSDTETLTPIGFPESRQVAYYFAVRTGGRLEIDPAVLPAGWQRLDWNMVPAPLREAGNRNAPALTLRAILPSTPLALNVIRHSLAEALKLRVAEGSLTTVLSPSGDQLTAVDVQMEVIQRSSLAVKLPEGGELFSIFVNGESVNSIRQSGQSSTWQFYILPGMDDRSAQVRFVYLVTGKNLRQMKLISPQLNVPLENVTWNVIAPPGFDLISAEGNLEWIGQQNESSYDRATYLSKVSGKRKAQAEQAVELLQQASELLQAGEQSKARWALNNVANRNALDAASNEDARVQLENLETQQAVVGLNTRRQRFFLDNKLGELQVEDNEQMLQAAAANPILQQDQVKFRPQELSQLLAGNTREDNAILQQIAARLVQHQRSSEAAPQAIVISLPEEGTVYRFSRGVQVAENAPLELDLHFYSQYRLQWWQWLLIGSLLLAIVSALSLLRTSR